MPTYSSILALGKPISEAPQSMGLQTIEHKQVGHNWAQALATDEGSSDDTQGVRLPSWCLK